MAIPSKFVEPRPFSYPEAAARKLLEIAAGIIADGALRMHECGGVVMLAPAKA